ncbi:Uncharacterized protein OBRU01_21365, partial [Operophtera brumata]
GGYGSTAPGLYGPVKIDLGGVLIGNSLVRRMLSGTSVYEAVSAGGLADADCQALYPKCKLDKKTVVKVLSQLVPS